MEIFFWIATFSVIVSLGPILGPHFGRDIIRIRRYAMIVEFQKMIVGNIQACEFVKYKYIDKKQEVDQYGSQSKKQEPDRESIYQFVLATLPLLVTLFCLTIYSLSTVIWYNYPNNVLPIQNNWLQSSNDPQPLVMLKYFCAKPISWVLASSFLASYINMWYNFMRALRNYEFHSVDCIESSIDILLSVFVSLVFYATFNLILELVPFAKPSMATSTADNYRLQFSILFAIAVAYHPDVIRRYIVNFARIKYIKMEKSERFNSLEIIPIEVIDGVDSDIRKRLEDYHIVSVQNLAAANPVMLFVETPFVIYELMDWVAQAQLITSIGLVKTGKLWSLGIRTILDLNYHAFQKPNDDFLMTIGATLFDDLHVAKSPKQHSADEVKRCIGAMVSAPHVARLIQLANALRPELTDSGPKSESATTGRMEFDAYAWCD